MHLCVTYWGDDFGDEKNVQKALDSYILSGALKLFREHKEKARFVHHTMLIHCSAFRDDHKAQVAAAKKLLREI